MLVEKGTSLHVGARLQDTATYKNEAQARRAAQRADRQTDGQTDVYLRTCMDPYVLLVAGRTLIPTEPRSGQPGQMDDPSNKYGAARDQAARSHSEQHLIS